VSESANDRRLDPLVGPHYPEEWTDANGVKQLSCVTCGGSVWPCDRFKKCNNRHPYYTDVVVCNLSEGHAGDHCRKRIRNCCEEDNLWWPNNPNEARHED